MSNRICVEPTKFEDVRNGTSTFGFRAYDDYAQTYNNTLESIPDDDLEFLRVAIEHGDNIFGDIIDFCIEQERGLYIADIWYDWEKVKPILSTVKT